MANCRIVNAQVESAVSNIKNISTTYKSDGEAFITALNAAIAEMEGDTKDALAKFINEGEGSVKTFVEESLPQAVDGMSQLLEANRSNFEETDKKIAESIAGSN